MGVFGMKNKAAGGFYGFPKGHEPEGKTKKPTACHLMHQNKHPGKQGCNCQFSYHKDIQPLQTLDSHNSTFSLHDQ
jgi:hypothetical protein